MLALSLAACDDALVDVASEVAPPSAAEGEFECTISAYISGPSKVFSYAQFRYTLNWVIASEGLTRSTAGSAGTGGCTITATPLGLASGTPNDVVVCGSGTTNGRPWIDVCTDYAPDGFTFVVNGSVRYFNGVDSGHQYAYASKSVVFDNSIGVTGVSER